MKDKKMEGFLEKLSKEMFGRSRKESIREYICVICGKYIFGFKDKLSKKEYEISGMCQDCQDEIFDEE